ncbi:AsmA family protein [Rhizobium sp. FY34]|uniref:AsmA family protein n=1 Tax=Rhizobium sp. FY34 TaxID=2562309 RepID=UPI0010C14B21|nr:AsmA family protein [Rhizobium sp. FY34]
MRIRPYIRQNRLFRFTLVAGGLALVLVLAFRLLGPILVSSSMVRESIEQSVEGWLGHDVVIDGTPVLKFWPQPIVTLSGITIRTKDAPNAPVLGRIDSLSAHFSLWPALRGQPVFNDFRLVRPQITLKVDDQNRSNWSSQGRLATAVQTAARAGARGGATADTTALDTLIGDVMISDGTLRMEASRGRTLTFENINGTIDWPRLSAPMRVRLQTQVRGELLALDLASANPLLLLGGLGTDLTATVKSTLFSGSFSGRADLNTYTFFSGDLKLAVPRVDRVVAWANLPVHTADRLHDVSLTAKVVTINKVLRFDQLAIAANGTKGTGVMDLTLATAEKPPRVTGTLAFDTLDLWLLVQAIADDRQETGPSGTPTTTPLERQLGFDVRFSANQAHFGTLTLDTAAVSVVSNGQKAEVEVLDSDLLNGSLTGKIRMDLQPRPLTTIRLTGRDLDFSSLAEQLAVHGPIILGPVSLDLDATLQRPLTQATAADLAGSLHIQARNGRIPALDLSAIRALAAGASYFTLKQAGDSHTDFDRLDLRAELALGSAEIQDARLETAQRSLTLSGVIPYVTRSLSLSATLNDKDSTLAPVNLFIGGAWPDAVIWPASPARSETVQP